MDKDITQVEETYNVFMAPPGLYLAIREISLAFGNKAKEIYFVKDISCAYKFSKHITKLEAKDYYHEFPSVLAFLLNNIEVKVIKVKTQYISIEN